MGPGLRSHTAFFSGLGQGRGCPKGLSDANSDARMFKGTVRQEQGQGRWNLNSVTEFIPFCECGWCVAIVQLLWSSLQPGGLGADPGSSAHCPDSSVHCGP